MVPNDLAFYEWYKIYLTLLLIQKMNQPPPQLSFSTSPFPKRQPSICLHEQQWFSFPALSTLVHFYFISLNKPVRKTFPGLPKDEACVTLKFYAMQEECECVQLHRKCPWSHIWWFFYLSSFLSPAGHGMVTRLPLCSQLLPPWPMLLWIFFFLFIEAPGLWWFMLNSSATVSCILSLVYSVLLIFTSGSTCLPKRESGFSH